MSEAVSAWVPPTRSLAGVLREAMAPEGQLRLLVATSVNGGVIPGAYPRAYGWLSFNGGPPVLVPCLQGAIPRAGEDTTLPGVTVYVLAWAAGTMLAIGYIDTVAG